MNDVTLWLDRLNSGDPAALDALVPLLYDELKSLAMRRKSAERRHHTLTSTALVHETYLRLLKQRRLQPRDRAEFLGIAAVTMRRVLVDHARRRASEKRGGSSEPIPLDEAEDFLSSSESREVLELNEALERLEAWSERAATVVHLRFFGGLSVQEISQCLEVTVRTVHRDWIAARAWLRKEVALGAINGPVLRDVLPQTLPEGDEGGVS